MGLNRVQTFLMELSKVVTEDELEFMEYNYNVINKVKETRKINDLTYALSVFIVREWKENGFVSVITFGRQGTGKSVYNMLVAYDVLSYLAKHDRRVDPVTWRDVIDYYVYFDLKDIVWRLKKQVYGRIPVLIWDDAGVHASSYLWFVDRKRAMLISRMFQTIRTKLNALLMNTTNPSNICKKLRDVDSLIVLVVKGPKGYSVAHGYRLKILPSGKHLIEKIFIDPFKRYIPEYDYYLEKRKKYAEYAIDEIIEMIEEEEKEKDLTRKLEDMEYLRSLEGDERKAFLTMLKKYANKMTRNEKYLIIRRLLEAGYSYDEIVYALHVSTRTIAKISKEIWGGNN